MGLKDSSLTRVQPLFGELLKRDPTGREWLPGLLASGDRAPGVLPEDLRGDPGTLVPTGAPTDAELSPYFEYPAHPPVALLRWLIENAPSFRREIRKGEFGTETTELRHKLMAGDPETKDLALAKLEELGVDGSVRRWWAFEGITRVDCRLETEKLVLFVEGKRTEKLSGATSWMPERNQLIRNLDLVGEVEPVKAAFVLLAVEESMPEPSVDDYRRGAPHLGEDGPAQLASRYLGQARWEDLRRELCPEFEFPDEVGPE